MNRYTETNVWKSFDATGDDSECVEDMLGTVRYYEKLARQAKWRGRVHGFCKFAALFVLFVVSFQIGRGL